MKFKNFKNEVPIAAEQGDGWIFDYEETKIADCQIVKVKERWAYTKGGFFSESEIRFSDLQISKKNIPKKYPELEI